MDMFIAMGIPHRTNARQFIITIRITRTQSNYQINNRVFTMYSV